MVVVSVYYLCEDRQLQRLHDAVARSMITIAQFDRPAVGKAHCRTERSKYLYMRPACGMGLRSSTVDFAGKHIARITTPQYEQDKKNGL